MLINGKEYGSCPVCYGDFDDWGQCHCWPSDPTGAFDPDKETVMKNDRFFNRESQRVFYADMTDYHTDTAVVKVVEGRNGYLPTRHAPCEVKKLNAANNVSEAEAQAAVQCSMFQCWENFDRLVALKEELGVS